jgi:hypothetical protein
VQQKSQPRNARREISVVACAEIPRALRLCRKLDSRARQEQAQNGDKIDVAERRKTTTLSIAYTLAGAGGFEPLHFRIGIRLSTARLLDKSMLFRLRASEACGEAISHANDPDHPY